MEYLIYPSGSIDEAPTFSVGDRERVEYVLETDEIPWRTEYVAAIVLNASGNVVTESWLDAGGSLSVRVKDEQLHLTILGPRSQENGPYRIDWLRVFGESYVKEDAK